MAGVRSSLELVGCDRSGMEQPEEEAAGQWRGSPIAAPGGGPKLSRRLGPWDLVLLGIGGSIGAGIFVITGTVAHDAGPGVAVSFLVAGLASILNALCYAELSTRFPALVGGAYLYAHSTFNELTAFLVFTHLMLDYHIGAANISRSLASYLATFLQTSPLLKRWMPVWIGPGGLELLHGWISINALAPICLALLTLVLCLGVRQSAMLNAIMTVTKLTIVLLVIVAGCFEVDLSNWTPFAPNGVTELVTGATVVFFAYVGFDAVANSAEECKNPRRDLPIGILLSLTICAILYVAVCLVITGMVPYYSVGGDAPLATAFSARGLQFVSILIDIGAVAGLTTTLLVGLYVQSRLYLGLGRDGLLPSIFARIHPKYRTPFWGQIWVGTVAGVLAMLLNVKHLSHILSVGCLVGYSVVCSCAIVLRLKQPEVEEDHKLTRWQEAVGCIIAVACLGVLIGFCFREKAHFMLSIIGVLLVVLVSLPLYLRQEYTTPPGFACPWMPSIPLLSIFVNMFLFAQLHWEAFVRFLALSILAMIFYSFYSKPRSRTLTTKSENTPLVLDEQA